MTFDDCNGDRKEVTFDGLAMIASSMPVYLGIRQAGPYLGSMKHLPLFTLLAISVAARAQCPLTNTDTCEVTIDANYQVVTGTQALSGANQCFHVQSGGDLDYDGVYSVFLVEGGGTVNVNGTGNTVLAKGGANVGFCGSGYANQVNHEAGATLTCMTGNSAVVCAQVTFSYMSGVTGIPPRNMLRYDPVGRRLLLDSPTQVEVCVIDAAGRTVLRAAPTAGAIDLSAIPSGSYLALCPAPSMQRLRFVLP